MIAKSMLLATLVVALAVFLSVGVDLQPYALPDYAELREECQEVYKDGIECCLASVDAMEKLRAFPIEGDSCPAHFTYNLMRCPGSYQWCEPTEQMK